MPAPVIYDLGAIAQESACRVQGRSKESGARTVCRYCFIDFDCRNDHNLKILHNPSL